MSGRKRKCVTIAGKLNILKVVKKSGNKKWVDIAKELGIAPSTLNSILAKATKIEESARVFGVQVISEHVFKAENTNSWKTVTVVPAAQGEGIPISRAVLCEKQMNWQSGSVLKTFMRRPGGYVNLRYSMPSAAKACAVRVTAVSYTHLGVIQTKDNGMQCVSSNAV